jgi:hypothetical protein
VAILQHEYPEGLARSEGWVADTDEDGSAVRIPALGYANEPYTEDWQGLKCERTLQCPSIAPGVFTTCTHVPQGLSVTTQGARDYGKENMARVNQAYLSAFLTKRAAVVERTKVGWCSGTSRIPIRTYIQVKYTKTWPKLYLSHSFESEVCAFQPDSESRDSHYEP